MWSAFGVGGWRHIGRARSAKREKLAMKRANSAIFAPDHQRYTGIAQLFHWVTAALIFSTIPIAWVMANMPEHARSRDTLFMLHKSLGLTILAIVALRLAWRAFNPAPKLDGMIARWEELSSHVSHWLLYIILVGMPVSGFIMSAASGYPNIFFGFVLPSFGKNQGLMQIGGLIHMVIGQWMLYTLIIIHVGATVWHTAVRRDLVLDRMLPPRS